MPNTRKPLTGSLYIRVMAVQDVDHTSTGRFARGPETFCAIKVEDNVVAKTKTTRADKWENEHHTIEVDKANEIEVTVYDKSGDQSLPIGLLWVRLNDVVEEMRRKKIEAEINSSGWVSADKMGSGSAPSQFNMNPQQPQFAGPPGSPGMAGAPPPMPPATMSAKPVDAWFALEPTGQIHLSIGFNKHTKDRRPFDVGLGRKGAIRQRKEEIHEMYGHKFITQQFYNIMRCALCGEFLKYSAGMQCADCKYTCHTKCYPSVVTKCISKSNAESDPDEEKINHRIPHRFDKFNNLSANWCCHCGYILPFGKKNCRKCSGLYSSDSTLITTNLNDSRMRPHCSHPLYPFGARFLRYEHDHGKSHDQRPTTAEGWSGGYFVFNEHSNPAAINRQTCTPDPFGPSVIIFR